MRRPPILATLVVAAAVATMVALGVWQLQRAGWKEGLIARYEAARTLPPVAWPAVPPDGDSLLFRRAAGFCTEVVGWRSVAGRSVSGEAGWSHLADCRTGGLEGPGMRVDAGWSRLPEAPDWRGGAVEGLIVPDRERRIRLVAAQAAPGLAPSAPPSPETMPNNHKLYAFQWFFFALAAAAIYALALRRRRRDALPSGPSAPKSPAP